MLGFEVTHFQGPGPARVGVLATARGEIATPAFMPVGTRGTVKTATGREVWLTGARMMLANTYHLMLRPGAEAVAEIGGVHALSGFEGPILTDSGGYQALSLGAALDDDGMTFSSTYDGTIVRLTPETAVATQMLLGSDVAVVLDDCPAQPVTPERLEAAVARTSRWARRSRDSHPGGAQALFGIVQGGIDPSLRERSAAEVTAVGFDGYAVGGLSVGESRDEMVATLRALEPNLPLDAPRYLMGVGDPLGLVAGAEAGMDLFDSVWPTRQARHGQALIGSGRLNLRNASHARASGPIDPECSCEACRTFSRGALRHLLLVGDPVAARLLTLHNLTSVGRLTARLRAAIRAGQLPAVAAEIRREWGDGGVMSIPSARGL